MTFTKKQQNIIELSIELISELGIQGFTIKNLAKKLEVTEGAIYRHFESKTEILYNILKAFQQECKITLQNACSSVNCAMDDIASIFKHHFNYFSERPAVAAVIFSESIFQNNNLLSKEVFSLLKMHEDALLCIIERGQSTGELRNGNISKEQLVRIIIGSIRYTVTKWRLSKYSFDIKEDGKILLKNIQELLKNK
jgi:AcrR family transcriptional regulator